MSTGELISYACGFPQSRIEGAPDWLNKDLWDLIVTSAKPIGSADEQRQLVQRALEERWTLQVKVLSRPGLVFVLIPGKRLKLTTSEASTGSGAFSPRLVINKDAGMLETAWMFNTCHD
jgi:uncharacterized protein (TIGR03435 family)